MTNKICRFTVLFALMATFIISGCARKEGEKRVIAAINDYKMTVEDFNYESREILNVSGILGEVPVTNKEMLDALITKEVLIQEAAREDLDKEKDFMRSIELYWEQTLLKNLLTRKSEEIAKKTVVCEDEINRYYNKMKNKIKAKIIAFSDEKYAKRGMGEKNDVLESWEKEPRKFAISYVIPSRWYALGEGQSPLEDQVFNVDTGKGRDVAKVNGRWGLIIVEETAPNDVGEVSSLKEEIISRIRAVKGKEAMDQWIDSLRSKTRIKIDKKVFDSLN